MPELRNQYTVSELNAQIRFLLEGSLSDIWVTGEISNFHYHPSSGHMYFTIKDDRGEMQCAMFRGNNRFLKFKPSNGMEIRVLGSVSIYEQRGQVQLIVSRMEPAGIGDLFKAFEALKKTLEHFEIINKDLISIFTKNNIKPIDCLNKKLDPNLHQAMMEIEDDEKEPGTIIHEVQKGFMIKERLLRPK